MNERTVRMGDHKGRTVRRGQAGTTTELAETAPAEYEPRLDERAAAVA